MLTILAGWGLWPAAIMLLSQWEAARIHGVAVPAPILVVTAAGTLAIYGMDRLAERTFLVQIEARHRAHRFADPLIAGAILIAMAWAIPHLAATYFYWLAGLGFAGLIYLLVTTGRWQSLPGVKEGLGAFCFCLLICGGFGRWDPALAGALFLLGLANFVWSGFPDRERDMINKTAGLVARFPKAATWCARLSAATAVLLFGWIAQPMSPFSITALAHLFWRAGPGPNIDWAFTPMLLVVVLSPHLSF